MDTLLGPWQKVGAPPRAWMLEVIGFKTDSNNCRIVISKLRAAVAGLEDPADSTGFLHYLRKFG